MGKNSPKIKISLDVLENLHPSQFEGAEYERIWHWYLKILYLKSGFRQSGAKIKISSDLLENVYNSQFEGAEYESYRF